jgi:glutaredoxin
MSERIVDLYGRPGCHLCDEARVELQALQSELGFEIREHDIEADDQLFKRYLERIPVVVIDGEEVCELFVEEAEIRKRLDTVGDA